MLLHYMEYHFRRPFCRININGIYLILNHKWHLTIYYPIISGKGRYIVNKKDVVLLVNILVFTLFIYLWEYILLLCYRKWCIVYLKLLTKPFSYLLSRKRSIFVHANGGCYDDDHNNELWLIYMTSSVW